MIHGIYALHFGTGKVLWCFGPVGCAHSECHSGSTRCTSYRRRLHPPRAGPVHESRALEPHLPAVRRTGAHSDGGQARRPGPAVALMLPNSATRALEQHRCAAGTSTSPGEPEQEWLYKAPPATLQLEFSGDWGCRPPRLRSHRPHARRPTGGGCDRSAAEPRWPRTPTLPLRAHTLPSTAQRARVGPGCKGGDWLLAFAHVPSIAAAPSRINADRASARWERLYSSLLHRPRSLARRPRAVEARPQRAAAGPSCITRRREIMCDSRSRGWPQWITGGKIHPRNQGRTSWGYTYKCCKPGCSCSLPPAF